MEQSKPSAAAVMDAAARCNLNRIRQLLAAGAGPQQLMTKTANAVTEACFGWWGGYDKREKTRLAVVGELVAAGCRVEGQALYRPIDRGELALLRFLIGHGAEVNVAAPKEYYTGVPKGCTPLGVAVQSGRTEVVAELIRAGADVNQRTGAKYGLGPSASTSPLVKAATWNHPRIIRMLAAGGADPNVCDPGDYYGTPLMTAIAFGHEEAVKELVSAGADVNQAAGRDGWLPLAYAKEKRDARIVKILENASASTPGSFDSKEELGKAAERGDVGVVKKLIARGADLNARCSFAPGNPTPLTLAAANGHAEVVRALLESGAGHEAVDTRGAPALFHAAGAGHAGVVRALLASGADVDVRVREPYEGMVTPLVVAAEGGHRDVVEALLAGGASVRHRSRTGKTALSSAAGGGHAGVVEVLLSAVRNTKNHERACDTPLWWAVVNGHAGCVKLLLGAGASPGATGFYEGKSVRVVDLARRRGKSKILGLLNSASRATSASGGECRRSRPIPVTMPAMAEIDYQSSDDRTHERGPVLRKLFGPSRDEIWSLLAQQIGGQFKPGEGWTGRSRVDAQVGQWVVTLDTFVVSTGKSTVTFTRMRAPFVNRDAWRFTITRAGIFNPIARALGFQDVEVGDAAFDKAFVVKSNDEQRVRAFLADADLRAKLALQPTLTLSVLDDEGWFGAKFPEGVDELKFHTVGTIKDLVRLEQLFDLFAATLHRLCHIGSAYEDDPKIRL